MVNIKTKCQHYTVVGNPLQALAALTSVMEPMVCQIKL